MGRVVPILVRPLLCHPLLTLPLEAKLILVIIFAAIATMKLYGLRMGLLTWFLSTLLLNRFSSQGFSTGSSPLAFSLSFPKNTFPKVLTNMIGFWKSFVCGGNMGGAGVVSSWFLRWFGLG
jgi:hypothetical protein